MSLHRVGRKLAITVLIIFIVLVFATLLTARHGDPALYPATDGNLHTVWVVNHGYHAGIVLPRVDTGEFAGQLGLAALTAVTTRFAGYRWVEIGWGDEHFYREVPDTTSLTVALAVRALFMPGNASVLHVVGLSSSPREVFAASDLAPIEFGDAAFARIAKKLDASFARAGGGLPVVELGPGIYGPSLFYRAMGTFSILNVCNHWVANLLDAGGVPTVPVLATFPQGLLLDLWWRSGIAVLPR